MYPECKTCAKLKHVVNETNHEHMNALHTENLALQAHNLPLLKKNQPEVIKTWGARQVAVKAFEEHLASAHQSTAEAASTTLG